MLQAIVRRFARNHMNNPLTELLSNRVLPEEIDELGHLSVPFYEARAIAASRKLAADLGCNMTEYASRGYELTLVDGYLRNIREQFLDAPLVVRGGVLQATATRLRFYQEIVNTEQDALSATFVHEFELRPHAWGEAIAFEDEVVTRAGECVVEIPEHGQPRSIDLAQQTPVLSLEDARARRLPCMGPREITADECDETGLFLREHYAGLPYRGFEDDDQAMDWVFETSDGRRLGIADLESRNVLYSLPRVGEQVAVFSANVSIGSKILKRSHWACNTTSGELISTVQVVSLPLDLNARRSAAIPPELRESMEAQFHPDLA